MPLSGGDLRSKDFICWHYSLRDHIAFANQINLVTQSLDILLRP